MYECVYVCVACACACACMCIVKIIQQHILYEISASYAYLSLIGTMTKTNIKKLNKIPNTTKNSRAEFLHLYLLL